MIEIDPVEAMFVVAYVAWALLCAFVLGGDWRPIERIAAWDARYDKGTPPPGPHPNCRCVIVQRIMPSERTQ